MRLSACLLIKEHKVYRNISWGRYRYLGNLSNILKLYSQQGASELAFIDVDNSLLHSSFRSHLYQCVQQACYPITLYSSNNAISTHAHELISGGLERIGVLLSIQNPCTSILESLVSTYGSSTISVIFNLESYDVVSAQGFARLSESANSLTEQIYQSGVREIVFQDVKAIGRRNGPNIRTVESLALDRNPLLIYGINGGVRSFNDVIMLHNCGFDLVCSGNFLSSSWKGDSVLPYFPLIKFNKYTTAQNLDALDKPVNPQKQNTSHECDTCLMNSSFSDFRKIGRHCSYCLDFMINREQVYLDQSPMRLNKLISSIKNSRPQKAEFDCVVGISGGVDSCFVLHHVVRQGLNPVAVTMDNGLNDSTANSNIRALCNKLGVPLYSHVIDWTEYSTMLKSMLDSDVIDIEILYDNACQAVCYNKALEIGCKYILSGSNTFTEGMRPPIELSWHKNDVKNILAILYRYQRKLGVDRKRPITYPFMGLGKRAYCTLYKKIEWVKYLDYINYNKTDALKLLTANYNFVPYGQKHFENIMTRLYQGYILPRKFSCVKESWHLSMEIISGLITREEALEIIESLHSRDWSRDIKYISDLLNMSASDFENYINRHPVPHDHYASDIKLLHILHAAYRMTVKKLIFPHS
jgi:imidazole glycerol phosphate synthase subunit HisF